MCALVVYVEGPGIAVEFRPCIKLDDSRGVVFNINLDSA